MIKKLDLDSWARRETYQFFRTYEKPFFSICTDVDVSRIYRESRSAESASFFLTASHRALSAVNAVPELRYRIRGDEVIVHYANGSRFTFMVEDWRVYEHDSQGTIIDSIFGKSQTADLNLVTCDGAWDHGAATYAKRLVVFTTLLPDKSAIVDGSALDASGAVSP